ncbi:MAG TPA: hypothetical protein VNA21_06345 [Steroidobacteraceae bacterium]|nr:hypothetical protein [Steroidobacteraceae bacterium]
MYRIVGHALQHGHGGAILFSPDGPSDDVRLKYVLRYRALARAMVERIVESDHRYRLVPEKPRRSDYVRMLESNTAFENAGEIELASGEQLIAGLTQVDGAVVVDPYLNVFGFGAEIRSSDEPPVLLSLDGAIVKSETIQRFGMRHRSAMRFCYAHANSIAIVLSQDGPVRVFANDGISVTYSDNVDVSGLTLRW